jgi:hypothetical protein
VLELFELLVEFMVEGMEDSSLEGEAAAADGEDAHGQQFLEVRHGSVCQ